MTNKKQTVELPELNAKNSPLKSISSKIKKVFQSLQLFMEEKTDPTIPIMSIVQ